MPRFSVLLIGLILSGCSLVSLVCSSSSSIRPQSSGGALAGTRLRFRDLSRHVGFCEDPDGQYTGADLTRITLRELDAQPFSFGDIEPQRLLRLVPCVQDIGAEGCARRFTWH